MDSASHSSYHLQRVVPSLIAKVLLLFSLLETIFILFPAEDEVAVMLDEKLSLGVSWVLDERGMTDVL